MTGGVSIERCKERIRETRRRMIEKYPQLADTIRQAPVFIMPYYGVDPPRKFAGRTYMKLVESGGRIVNKVSITFPLPLCLEFSDDVLEYALLEEYVHIKEHPKLYRFSIPEVEKKTRKIVDRMTRKKLPPKMLDRYFREAPEIADRHPDEGVPLQHYDCIAGTLNLCRGGEFRCPDYYLEYLRDRGMLPATTEEVAEARRSLERYEQKTKKKFEPI